MQVRGHDSEVEFEGTSQTAEAEAEGIAGQSAHSSDWDDGGGEDLKGDSDTPEEVDEGERRYCALETNQSCSKVIASISMVSRADIIYLVTEEEWSYT